MLVSLWDSRPPVQLSATAMVVLFRVKFASDDFVQSLTIARKNTVGERDVESTLNLVECFVGLLRFIAPQAQMNLNLAGGAQHRSLHIFVAFINGCDALFDVRLTQAGYAQFAMKKAKSSGSTRKTRRDGFREESTHLFWHTGQQHNYAITLFDPQSGGGTSRIIQCFGAFGNHGLAHIYFRHFAPEAAKTGFDGVQDAIIALQSAAQQDQRRFRASNRRRWDRGRRRKLRVRRV